MSKADINGIEMHYQEFGEGDAIVFCHGAGGNLLSWWQQIPYFSRDYRCVTIDHRGFGRSLDTAEAPGRSMFVEDLRALLDHLGIDSAHLVAQSMGGWTCLGLTVEHPERVKSLVMADTPGGVAEPELQQAFTAFRKAQAATEEIGVRALGRAFQERNPNLANLYLQISRTNPPRVPFGTEGLSGGPMAADLAKVTTPTLFIVGEDDDITPAHIIEMAAGYIPGAKLLPVPSAGHSVYFERPDVFNFEVERFLNGL